jgi:predicted ATPase
MRGWKVFQFHDTSATAGIKQKHPVGDSRTLQPDGANLAALLFGLKNARTQEVPSHRRRHPRHRAVL